MFLFESVQAFVRAIGNHFHRCQRVIFFWGAPPAQCTGLVGALEMDKKVVLEGEKSRWNSANELPRIGHLGNSISHGQGDYTSFGLGGNEF